ncbi:MAG TPA: TonB-dependent receptor plug domain-containing protein, partial [Caulobacteraceae bacterium]|nr:TonB-dependent receptor plug domain-containing protein [Caulobacteraceae bacterium]
MITGAAFLFAGAAQAANEAAANPEAELVVTGSRIPSPNLTSTSPIAVVNSTEIKSQGTINVETLINSLPQAYAGQTNAVANGATGTATVNLRGLGSVRTLVLIDGTRLMPADAASPVADLNNIPAALVDRVEVLTGGASAVYGSDALGGVVNFIMKKDFEGLRIDAQYGFA